MSRDVNKLKEPFRSSIKELLKRAKDKNIPVLVTDTIRTIAEQRKLVHKGYSKTMNSKHLTGEACDIAFEVNGKLSYDAKLYRKLYRITRDIPFVIWPYKDLGWKWDKPHHQYDASKKIGYNTPMSEQKEQIKRLQQEVRKLTKEVHVANKKLEKEIKGHKETLEKQQADYRKWQETLDLLGRREEEIKRLKKREDTNEKILSKIADLIEGHE